MMHADLLEPLPAGTSSEEYLNAFERVLKKLDEFKEQEKIEQKKQMEYSEKIDQLNQETDTLLDEIDKWQT